MIFIDTHCHVNFNAYKEDGEEVMRRAREKGIGMIVVGSQIDTSRRAVAMAQEHGGDMWAAVGLHPVHLVDEEIEEEGVKFRTRAERFDYEEYKKLASNSRVVAIGEMGLDYYRLNESNSSQPFRDVHRTSVGNRLLTVRGGEGGVKELQRETFEQGIRLASELDKALIVHTRPSQGTYDAYQDVIEILNTQRTTHPASMAGSRKPFDNVTTKVRDNLQLRGVVHCFGGSVEQAKQIIDLGFYIGVTGIVTFKNAKVVQEVVREMPIERLLVETDAPYLAPEPHRGARNEPAYVGLVARKVAELKGLSVEEVEKQTTENARKLFRIQA